MRSLAFLLIACLTLVAGGADAKEPEWTFKIEDRVDTIDISGDGKYVVAGSDDNKLYLFGNDGVAIWNYSADSDVNAVAISTSGEYIVAGTKHSKLYLFSRNSSIPLWNHTFNAYNRPVTHVDISADGQHIIAASKGIYFFHRNNSDYLYWHQTAGNQEVRDIAISDDGKYVAIVSGQHQSSEIVFFDLGNITETGHSLWVWSFRNVGYEHVETIDFTSASIAISADGNYTVVGTSSLDDDKEQLVYLFGKHNNAGQEAQTPIWTYETSGVKDVAISADGEHIIVSANYENIYLFSNYNNSLLWTKTLEGGTCDGYFDSSKIAISMDGNYVIATCEHKLFLYQRENGLMLWSASGGDDAVVISSEGNYIVSGSYDIKFWSKTTVPKAEFNVTVAVEGLPVFFDAGCPQAII